MSDDLYYVQDSRNYVGNDMPKSYIDAKTRPAVDMQYVKRAEALAGTGIELRTPPKARREVAHCHGCGRFLSVEQVYSPACPSCGADNRP